MLVDLFLYLLSRIALRISVHLPRDKNESWSWSEPKSHCKDFRIFFLLQSREIKTFAHQGNEVVRWNLRCDLVIASLFYIFSLFLYTRFSNLWSFSLSWSKTRAENSFRISSYSNGKVLSCSDIIWRLRD